MARVRVEDLAPKRDAVLARFVDSFAWIPHWRAEVTLADEGLENRLLTVEQYAGGSAVRAELARVYEYRAEAFQDSQNLAAALVSEHKFQPVSVDVLRTDHTVQRGLAKYLLFKDALKSDAWPVHQGRYFERRLKPFSGMVQDKEPAELVELWNEAYPSATARHLHWLTEMRGVWMDPRIRAAIRSRRVQPVSQEA